MSVSQNHFASSAWGPETPLPQMWWASHGLLCLIVPLNFLFHWVWNPQVFWSCPRVHKVMEEGDANTKYFHLSTIVNCRAEKEEAAKLIDCLNTFRSWSGQLISLEKSSVHFGNNVGADLRTSLCGTLDMVECKYKSNYLDAPFCKGSSKVAEFRFNVEKIDQTNVIYIYICKL